MKHNTKLYAVIYNCIDGEDAQFFGSPVDACNFTMDIMDGVESVEIFAAYYDANKKSPVIELPEEFCPCCQGH